MKNHRRNFLPAALLLLFVAGAGAAAARAQNRNAPAQGAASAEQRETPARRPEPSESPAEQRRAGAERDAAGAGGREDAAGQKVQGQRQADQRAQGQRGAERRGGAAGGNETAVTDLGEITLPVGARESNRDLQTLEARVAALERQMGQTESWLPEWMPDWLRWVLAGLLTAAAVVGIIFGYGYLRNRKERERGELNANFDSLRRQQKVFAEKLRQLEDVSKNLSQQIAQQKTELSGLRQLSRNVTYAPPQPTGVYQPQPAEVPRFPVMVDDYLAKVKGRAIPVKYDYKERMLVEDVEHEGNLLVVRDDADGDALYLVPSFGFFQKKSDYTTYFENYYNCARPVSGSVWIRQPAMVIRVNGGWQLEQLGELEVR